MTSNSSNSSLRHVAIIMDGNGRWANSRSHSRIWGHVRGAAVVSKIVREADNLGLKCLTLYAFSSENWSRPLPEVKTLFILLKKFLRQERDQILENKIRFKVIGDVSYLPEETQKLISDLEQETCSFGGLKLTFAFNYGGRSELINAINKCIKSNPDKPVSESDIEDHLYSPDTGDVDLLIRTGGDQRVSNFLLWQIAYAELFFTPTKWPEFTCDEFRTIINNVAQRERRFGNLYGNKSYVETVDIAQKNKDMVKSEKMKLIN